MVDAKCDECDQLRAALAAEREKVELLQRALVKLGKFEEAKAALAKIRK
jgi:hypothetical protein